MFSLFTTTLHEVQEIFIKNVFMCLEPVETSSLNRGDSLTYPQHVCGTSRSQEHGIFSGLQKVVEAPPRHSKSVEDFQAFLEAYFSSFMGMFKLA